MEKFKNRSSFVAFSDGQDEALREKPFYKIRTFLTVACKGHKNQHRKAIQQQY